MSQWNKTYGYVTSDLTKVATVDNTFKDIGPLNTPLSSLVYNSGSINQTLITGPSGTKEWLIETNRGTNGNYGGYLRSTNAGGVFDFGSGDFTAETWFNNRVSSNDSAALSITPTPSGWAGLLLYCRTASFYTRLAVTTTGPLWSIDNHSSYSLNTWNHYAVTRSGNTFKVWINGVEAYSYTSSTVSTKTSSYLWVNGIYPGQGGFNSFYHKGIRVIKGQCIYTGNFTPDPMPSYNEYANTVYIPGNNITNKGVAKVSGRNGFLTRVRTVGTV